MCDGEGYLRMQGNRSQLGARHGKGANVNKCVILSKEQVKYALDDFRW